MSRVRSPNYPIISLPDALPKIQTVYNQEHLHPSTREVIAKALGYGGVNGASAGVISALSKYGLLEPSGDQFRVSTLAQDLVLHGPGDPEYAEAVTRAALLPSLYSELHALYGENLPSDNNLKAVLVKKGFNPNSVAGVIRSYRETIELLRDVTSSQPVDSGFLPETNVAHSKQNPAPSNPPGFGGMLQPFPEKGWDGVRLWFKISDECEAGVDLKGRVTQEAVERLIAHLQLSLDVWPKKADLAARSSTE